jgi:hypothetical protein
MIYRTLTEITKVSYSRSYVNEFFLVLDSYVCRLYMRVMYVRMYLIKIK